MKRKPDRVIKIYPEYHLIVTEGTEYWPKLTQHLKQIGAGEYEKNRKDMYQILRPYMECAIRNAKRLNALNEGKLPSKAAPGTKVYELIEILKPYLTIES